MTNEEMLLKADRYDELNSIEIDGETITITDEYRKILTHLATNIRYSNKSLFITGQAGTGKSTLIKILLKRYGQIPILAPTGVAALNIGGQTIHSFFRLPATIHNRSDIKVVKGATELFRNLKYLIIDEISMVRADLFDTIDECLQVNKGNDLPYGGIKLICIGDLFQLSPVVKKEEEKILEQSNYVSPYFFDSKAMRRWGMKTNELTKVFRQDNLRFVELLSDLREGKNLDYVLPVLNKRVRPYLDDEAIILTPYNKTADEMNEDRLQEVDGELCIFHGEATGDMEHAKKLPAPMELRLKIGARVMFTKNDPNKRYSNGKIGTVTDISKEIIYVDGIPVMKETWESLKYSFNVAHAKRDSEGKITNHHDCIEKTTTGKYTQYPLTLAWAVTIHKAQSKTFDKVNIDISRGIFADGQLYVAVSRCKTITGITLSKPIRDEDIIINNTVLNFYERIRQERN